MRTSYNTFILAALAVAAAAGLPMFTSGYTQVVLNLAVIHAILVVGLNFILGYAGQISLGHAALWAIGGYSSALLALRLQAPFWLALVGAMVFTGLVSYAIGVPMLRLRGHYLALATLGFNTIVEIVLRNWVPVTGGTNGLVGIPAPTLMGYTIKGSTQHYYLLLFFLVVLSLVAYKVRHSPLGRAMMALRDDEMAAGTSGINVAQIKTYAFVIAGVYAGIAGSLYAHTSQYLAPTEFTLIRSITFLSMLIVGGEGSILGAILGAGVLTFLPEWLRFLDQAYLAFFGVMMLLILVFMPGGIVGSANALYGAYLSRKRKLHQQRHAAQKEAPGTASKVG